MGQATQAAVTEHGVHAFERAGLGKAPFRFVGPEDQDLCYGERILNRAEYERTGIRCATKPGGSCAYCGTYIVVMCNVESADGRSFHVGTDCIEKVGTAGMRRVVNETMAKRRRAKAAGKRAKDRETLTALLADDSVRALLASKPHPSKWGADNGRTLLDWAEWMLSNGGGQAHAKAIKAVREEPQP